MTLTKALLFITVVVVFAAAVLYSMGRVPYCTCGHIWLWYGNIWSSENSQHISDWYTFSHIIHGFIFYWLLQRLFAKKSQINTVPIKMCLAVLIEAAWEIFENTPLIIGRYRATTLSLDYYGDSVINSVFDILAAVLGFWLASKLPVWMTVLLLIVMELVVGYVIHDNLTLNILMLMYPIAGVKSWQLKLNRAG